MYLTSTQTQIAFYWTKPTQDGGSPLTGYKISWAQEIENGTFGEYIDLILLNNANTLQFYLTTGIVTGGKYRFRVSAKNSVGYSLPSNYIEMMPATTPGSPETPTITAVSSSAIQIEWTFDDTLNGGTPIIDYIVYWDNGSQGNIEVAAASTGLWHTYEATEVLPGETYGFWIVAKNYLGPGTPSDKVFALAAQEPDQPDTPTVKATYNSYQVSWVAPNN